MSRTSKEDFLRGYDMVSRDPFEKMNVDLTCRLYMRNSRDAKGANAYFSYNPNPNQYNFTYNPNPNHYNLSVLLLFVPISPFLLCDFLSMNICTFTALGKI